MPLIEIDNRGDLTLELSKIGSGSDETTRSLLVSSRVLSLASPVFSAMLSPCFREGQRSASGTLDPIPLPDDDVEAMTVLCQILHYKYDTLPPRAQLELFKNLALLCDKYDCVTPLRYVSEHWLWMWEKTAGRELETLLFISHVFDRPERFSALSTRIIKEFSGNLRQLDTLWSFEALPEELLGALHEQREATLRGVEIAVAQRLEAMELSSALVYPAPLAPKSCMKCWRAVAPAIDFCTNCRGTTISATCSVTTRRGVYVGVLKEAGLDPIGLWSTMSTKSITEIAKCVDVAIELGKSHSCNGMADCPLGSVFWDLASGVHALANGTRGLCLDCVKAERKTTGLDMCLPSNCEEPQCRVSHAHDY